MLWLFILTSLLLFLCDISTPLNVIFPSDFVQTKYFYRKRYAAFHLHILQDEWNRMCSPLTWEINTFETWLGSLWCVCLCLSFPLLSYEWKASVIALSLSVRRLLANVCLTWHRCGNLNRIPGGSVKMLSGQRRPKSVPSLNAVDKQRWIQARLLHALTDLHQPGGSQSSQALHGDIAEVVGTCRYGSGEILGTEATGP